MRLADVQKSLAAGLTGRAASAGLAPDDRAVERMRRALVAKRRQAAAHLLPRLRAALGPAWARRFADHAARYTPGGLLHHVDDAWELAAAACREPDRRLADAAHDDLVFLRLRFSRRPAAGVRRIRERRAPLVALVHAPIRCLMVRLPGLEARVWSLRI